MKKKLLAVLLSAILTLSVTPILPFTSSAETVSGTCGDNLTWKYNTSTYTLTISGMGTMRNYTSASVVDGSYVTTAPWQSYYKTIESVVINIGVTSIGDSAFYGCSEIKNISIPDSVTSLGSEAFRDCFELESIFIPCSIPYIKYSTFSGCVGLKNVTLSNGVTTIGNYAFSGCKNILEITVPNSVNFIAEGAFCGCSSLQNITIPFIGDRRRSENQSYQFPLGYIFGTYSYTGGIATNQYYDYSDPGSWMTYTCYYIPEKLKTVTITDIEHLPRGAFLNCSKLTKIELPETLTSIGESAFSRCTSLSSIVIPNGVTTFNDSVFYNCTSLTDIKLPNMLTNICIAAFYNCSSLVEINIPNSIITIGSNAFAECSRLETIYYCGTAQEWLGVSIGVNNAWLVAANRLYHMTSDWIIDKSPSAYESGLNHKECTICGKVLETEIIPDTHAPGDIDGDGEMTNQDLIALFQYLSGWDVPVNNVALDIDGDGEATNQDLILLFQKLSGWDVEIQ